MKKTLALLLAALLTLSACGGPSGSDRSDNFDELFAYEGVMSNIFLCGTEDTLYFRIFGDSYLYYIDKATGFGGPLCGKPECPHTGKNCNAFANSIDSCPQIYDGRLYWAATAYVDGGTGGVICSMALDGTDRQTVREIREEYYRYDCSTLFHRGYAWNYGAYNEMVDGQNKSCHYVCAIPLDPDEEPVVILNEPFIDNGNGSTVVTLWGDDLYILTVTPILREAEEGSGRQYDTTGRNTYRCMRWDRETGELETLMEEDVQANWTNDLCATEDGLIYTRQPVDLVIDSNGRPVSSWGDHEMEVCRIPYEGGEPEVLFTMRGANQLANRAIAGGVVGGHLWDKENQTLYVQLKDLEGNTLVDDSFKLDWTIHGTFGPYFNFRGVDEDYAYFGELMWDDACGVVAVALDGSGAKMLWTNEAYITEE